MKKTLLGEDILETTKGILYLCEYRNEKIIPVQAIQFTNGFEALQAYANIHNPPSQLAKGKTHGEFLIELDMLHKNMQDAQWQKRLGDYL